MMNMLYPVKLNTFYQLVEKVFNEVRFPLRFSNFSKRMYGNFTHVFLLVYKEKLNLSYRRFVQVCEEVNLQRMLCIKRIPHYTTLQKFLQKIDKVVFERMVRACKKILNLQDIEASIDGTGFSNTNPSHYYTNRIDGVKVKNYTRTTLLADNKTKLVLDLRTHSDNTNETTDFIPLVKNLSKSLKTVLADKAYDSMSNREYCWANGISVHIPLRDFKNSRLKYGLTPHFKKKRAKASKLFNPTAYKRRALIESINSSIKRTLGSWVCSRKPNNQQKTITIKTIAYNIEKISNTIKITLLINA
jgi:transposase